MGVVVVSARGCGAQDFVARPRGQGLIVRLRRAAADQFRGETLPMEGTRRRRGEGDVRCELSMDEEPSMVIVEPARGAPRFAGYFGRLAIAADPRDSRQLRAAAAATRVDGWGW